MNLTDDDLRQPWLAFSSLPDSERASADHLNFLTGQMLEHLTFFRAGVRLFQYCLALHSDRMSEPNILFDRDKDYTPWVYLAARSAILEIYHFGKTLQSVRGMIGLCKSLAPHVNVELLKCAQKTFEAHFSRAERMRHAVGHAAEMTNSPENLRRNFMTDDTGGWLITNIENHTFKLKHEGEKMAVDLNYANVARIAEITAMVFTALRPAAESTFPRPSKSASQPSPDQTGRR